ncbi:hypothetical protein HNR21_003220 [Actinomadura cellulosilytica]|uniref:Uncharacterized protein n=1 Tax=Thermomonospora cellulosilytica TaxID=1411118 RepID=A0A7W3MYN1_9ACTN|nr:hypothetical protein [Thermomonospora cellulosilytica]
MGLGVALAGYLVAVGVGVVSGAEAPLTPWRGDGSGQGTPPPQSVPPLKELDGPDETPNDQVGVSPTVRERNARRAQAEPRVSTAAPTSPRPSESRERPRRPPRTGTPDPSPTDDRNLPWPWPRPPQS